MERSVHKLNIAQATEPIPDYGKGPDPYQGYQVHDYRQISFLRMDPRKWRCLPFPLLFYLHPSIATPGGSHKASH